MNLENRLFLRLTSKNGNEIRVNPKCIQGMDDSNDNAITIYLRDGAVKDVLETMDNIEKQVDDLENRSRMLDALARHARLDALENRDRMLDKNYLEDAIKNGLTNTFQDYQFQNAIDFIIGRIDTMRKQ